MQGCPNVSTNPLLLEGLFARQSIYAVQDIVSGGRWHSILPNQVCSQLLLLEKCGRFLSVEIVFLPPWKVSFAQDPGLGMEFLLWLCNSSIHSLCYLIHILIGCESDSRSHISFLHFLLLQSFYETPILSVLHSVILNITYLGFQ